MRISVDLGFGYVKAVNELGNTIDFPSVVELQIGSDVSGSLFGTNEDYKVVLKNEIGEKTYFVGDAAMSMGGSRAFDDEAVNNKNLDVLISSAIALLMGDSEMIDLAVGLPMGFYSAQKDSLKKRLEGFEQTVKIKGEEKHIKVNTVFVFPQGAGAYYASIFDINGEVKNADLVNKAVGVVDVGHRTTDFIFMTRTRKGIAPVSGLTGSLDFGMKDVFKLVQQNVINEIVVRMRQKGKPAKEPKIEEIEKSVLWFQDKLDHQGETYALTKYVNDANKTVASNIADSLKQRWSDKVDSLAAIMIGGGGGDTMYEHFTGVFHSVRKVEDPRFANAKGYLAAQAQALAMMK